jgi:uncharacterized protein (TIGR03083 family)
MDHRAAWRAAAARFADVLDRAEVDQPVPACPDWVVADLAYHLGRVYDRFTEVVRGGLTDRAQVQRLVTIERPEDDHALSAWFRARAGSLAIALADLHDEDPLWNFTRAPQKGAWLPRRMLHETTVHRHDLEAAVGTVTAIAPEVARDGVDEYLRVLSTAAGRWDDDTPAVLRVEEVPGGPSWQLRFEPGELGAIDDDADMDVCLRGGPAALLLALWRRAPLSSVEVTGPQDVAERVLATLSR